MTILAEVSSGRSDFDSSSPTNLERPGSAARRDLLDRGGTAFGRGLERRGADGDDLLAAAGLNRGDGIAGIDRALERVGAVDRDDFGNLRHVELGGDARHVVLAVGRGGREDRVVVRGERQDQRLHRLGNHLGIERVVGKKHLLHAGELGGGRGDGVGTLTRNQHMHRPADLRGGGHDLGGRVLESLVVVFGNNERGHLQITPASFFSLSSSSATVFTLTPAWRLGGSDTLRTFSLGVISTP